jgi:uncharacterized cofD-like protein
MRQFKSFLKWFYPGLAVKRWLFLALGGAALFLGGLISLLRPHLHIIFLLPPFYSGIFLLTGLILTVIGFYKAGHAVAAVLSPRRRKPLVEYLYNLRHLERGPKVAALGGGTGLSTLLRGLKNYTSNITAVVTVTDDGGSSGKLRGELGILPPGDLRNCLLALADTEPVLEELFQFRFPGGKGLEGHNFGNLFIAAMTEMYGFERALQEFSKVLAVRGRVLPVTLGNVRLKATYCEGFEVVGESRIASTFGRINNVSLVPQGCQPLPEVLTCLQAADIIVLGPGSLYSSIIPNLLVPGVAEAIRRSKALKVYVCNLMTQKGETIGMTASQHLKALEKHAGSRLVDLVVVNSQEPADPMLARRYSREGGKPVEVDWPELQKRGVGVISAPLCKVENGLLRHDADELAQLILREFWPQDTGLDLLFSYKMPVLHIHSRRAAVKKRTSSLPVNYREKGSEGR